MINEQLVTTAAKLIRSFEGYIPKPIWDVNAYRLGYGSDTIELPNGSFRKVLKTDVTTQEYAEKDLQRRLRTEFIPKVSKQVGEAAWNNLPIPAQASLVSFAYNYGSITKKAILEAARSGDVNALAKAIVDSTYNDNAKLPERQRNALRDRRKKEADFSKTILNKASELVIKAKENPGITILGIAVITIALGVLYKTIKNKNK